MGAVFRFKQFEVDQGECAMKINTDGVLLGAHLYGDGFKYILDIGTGTGVIALMAAQWHPEALVDAIEIDELAYLQAVNNFRKSPFGDRMEAYHSDFIAFKTDHKYDLIFSNPPFYTDSLRNPDERKSLAKHSDFSFFEHMIDFVDFYLSSKGKFKCVLPVELADWIVCELLSSRELFLLEELAISSFENSNIIRKIITISRENLGVKKSRLVIYKEKGMHSSSYKECLSPFFLAF
ncbi:methyltransferase [Sphingobacterium sp. UT-1RO-CII-1]|uniref:tRNA1(Val) (adenine(37)-N6)-methyltransferase n=1 Tax=Sphingobacterium sp. UT-1RO-CII-1 TaxID=2995225 RepID=UPI00227A32C7|nr:methyltransferase [Sphingobacterium sp. UT-1RO-CII-1]MCY4778233.1 methyltransferase [Sphingobacterium sp. UT-1RO-CII-1]